MFLDRIAFLATLSRKIQLGTVEQLPTQTATQLSNSITKIVRLYACTGFSVQINMMDQEFDKIEDTCKMVEINTIAAREHASKIEFYICLIK